MMDCRRRWAIDDDRSRRRWAADEDRRRRRWAADDVRRQRRMAVDDDRRHEPLWVAQVIASLDRMDDLCVKFMHSVEIIMSRSATIPASSLLCSSNTHAQPTQLQCVPSVADFDFMEEKQFTMSRSDPPLEPTPPPSLQVPVLSRDSLPDETTAAATPHDHYSLPLSSYEPKPSPASISAAPLLPLPFPRSFRNPMAEPSLEAKEKPLHEIGDEKNFASPNPPSLYSSPSFKSSEDLQSQNIHCSNITSVIGSADNSKNPAYPNSTEPLPSWICSYLTSIGSHYNIVSFLEGNMYDLLDQRLHATIVEKVVKGVNKDSSEQTLIPVQIWSIYGPVQELWIPYLWKRIFGFFTFLYPEIVKLFLTADKLILAKGNAHFVCDAEVLVKPYKEKGKGLDMKQHGDKGDFSGCATLTGLDSRDPFNLQPFVARKFYSNDNQNILLHRKLEKQREFQQAIDLMHRRFTGLQFLDLSIFNHYIMQNEGKLFQSSYPKSFRDLVGKNGVIVVHGEQQKRLHAIVVNIMKLEKISSNSSDVQIILFQTINYLLDKEVVVLQDVCSKKVAINLMVNQLMGMSSESKIKEIACFGDGCLYVPINLPGFIYHIAVKERKGIIAKIKNMIANGHQRGGSIERSGVLSRLVEEENLNDNQIVDFIINLLFAGNKTITKIRLFVVYFLTQCPQALELFLIEHECIRRRIHNEILEWDDYRAILFNQCVFDENLKLEGIAIWLLREAKANVDDKDFTIPQGYLILPFLLVIQLDEGIYPGALPFNPWRRLAEENKEKRNWRISPYFSSFGGRARFSPDWQLSSEETSICPSPKEGFTYSDLTVVQQFQHMTFSSLQHDWFTISSLLLAFTHPNKFVDIYQSGKIFDPGGLLMSITPISFQMTRLDGVELF